MRIRTMIVAGGLVTALAGAAPALASSPTASCLGQQLSVYGPTYGAELGHAVAFEARNPAVIGVDRLGEWVSGAALSDRTACPVD